LESYQKGRIIIDGITVSHNLKNIEAIRQEVGMVFQQFNLFPHLTVLDNVTLGQMWVRGWKKSASGGNSDKTPRKSWYSRTSA
jgi:general L-amino acid transport system ATP-binding protein